MGQLLDAVIKKRQLDELQERNLSQVPTAINAFMQAREKAVLFDLERRKTQAYIDNLVNEASQSTRKLDIEDRIASAQIANYEAEARERAAKAQIFEFGMQGAAGEPAEGGAAAAAPTNRLLARGLLSKEFGVPFEELQTPEEQQAASQRKAEEQATAAVEKERQVNLMKVRRLGPITDVAEKRFLETSPYSVLSQKLGERLPVQLGLMPLMGFVDIWKSNLQATEPQRTDKAYQDFIQGFRAQLARAMGDVGNLSEPEQRAALKLIPTLHDTKETGLKKIKNLREFIETLQLRSDQRIRAETEGSTTPRSYEDYLKAIGR